MERSLFEDDARWRYQMSVNLVVVRQLVSELTLAIGVLFLSSALANRFSDLPLYVAAGVSIGAGMSVWRAKKALKWLEEQPITSY